MSKSSYYCVYDNVRNEMIGATISREEAEYIMAENIIKTNDYIYEILEKELYNDKDIV